MRTPKLTVGGGHRAGWLGQPTTHTPSASTALPTYSIDGRRVSLDDVVLLKGAQVIDLMPHIEARRLGRRRPSGGAA